MIIFAHLLFELFFWEITILSFVSLFFIIRIIYVVYCKIITIIDIIESSLVLLTEHFPMLRAPVPFITDQGPRVDKPHLASISRIRPAVAGRALKDVAKVVRNCSGVTDWHNRKFTQDMLDGNDIKNRLFVVKLVNYLWANRF